MNRTLRVAVPGSIVYVSGTVNDVAVTWTLDGDAWQTTAERTPMDVYRVELTAINTVGTAASYGMTLYYGLHLVTDRTGQDVAQGTEKGFYNASDLNRVGAAVRYIAERFGAYGYAVTVTGRLDWTTADIPRKADMDAYLADIAALRGAVTVLESTPETPESMAGLDWARANDIEKILEDLDFLITNMAAGWYYSGDLFSGEV